MRAYKRDAAFLETNWEFPADFVLAFERGLSKVSKLARVNKFIHVLRYFTTLSVMSLSLVLHVR